MNYNRPYKNMADQVAGRGRYGDTTLMHVNPAEVQALSNVAPLTVNPDTGYPEAFLPFLAPILGSLGGTALATSGALGALSPLATSGIAALGSGLATTAATGSLEEGMLAGLTGFGLGQVAQAGNISGNLAEAGASSGVTPDQLANIGAEFVPAVTNPVGAMGPVQLSDASMKLAGTGVAGLNPVQTAALTDAVNQPGIGGMFSNAGIKGAGSALMNPANLAPTAIGMGGIAVEEDYKNYVEGMENAEQERKDKREADRASYVEQIPGRVNLQYASGNNTPPPSSLSGSGLGGPYANRYAASGGSVQRFANGGPTYSYLTQYGYTYDPNTGMWTGPNGMSFPDPGFTPGNPPDGGGDGVEGETPEEQGYQYEGTPGQFRPPSDIGATPPRGYNALPAGYMPGFDPEFQYLTNLTPSATDIRGNPAYSSLTGGAISTPFGDIPTNVTNPNATEVDPNARDLSVNPYAYGSDWNEFLMGNESVGRESYLDEYRASNPYYQYADMSFDNIFGGGGYGTPDFQGYYGSPNFIPVNTTNPAQPNPYESQISSLNARIDELMARLNQGSSEEVQEDNPEVKPEVKPEDTKKNKEPIWEFFNSSINADGFTVTTYIDTNPNSPTYNTTKEETGTEKAEEKNKEPIWGNPKTITLNNGQTQTTLTDTNPDSPTYGQPKVEISGEVTMEQDENGNWVPIGTSSSSDDKGGTEDTPPGGSGDDSITGGAGNDIITDGAGNDIITDGAGNDIITDGAGNDIINDGAGNDIINGGAGNDIINGGAGNDTITTLEDLGLTPGTTVGAGTPFSFTIPKDFTLPANTDATKSMDKSPTPVNTGFDYSGMYNPYNMNYLAGFNMPGGGFAEGGPVPQYQDGGPSLAVLEDYAQDLPMQPPVQQPMSNPKVEQLVSSFEDIAEQRGQPLSEGDRDLLRKTSLVLLGDIQDDGSIISEFVSLFGPEQLDNLKKYLSPSEAQTKGIIEGEGGGMDDKVKGTLGDEEVALSPGEYIVTADVVSDLGDGNNAKGAEIMDQFMERVRVAKHGTPEQPDPVNLDEVMPV